MRIAYLKNGDAVDQCQRLLPLNEKPVTSGIDAFIDDFLRGHPRDEILVLSKGFSNREYIKEPVVARTYDGKSSGLVRFLTSVKLFRDLIRFKPNWILCGASGDLLLICVLVSRILNVPVIHSRHNLVPDLGRGKWQDRLRRWEVRVLRGLPGVVCHGPYLFEQLRDLGAASGNIQEFDVGVEVLHHANESVRTQQIIYVGRIVRPKGAFDLLDSFAALNQEKQGWKLKFAGSGPALADLEAAVSARNLDGEVEVLGEVSHHEVLELVRQSAFMVCPTRKEFPEGRCMSAMEAIACGIPVIAPNFGPFPFLVQHNLNGLLYEPDSISEMGAALASLIKNKSLLEHLSAGASDTSNGLRKPLRTFNEAVEIAMDKVPREA